MMPPLLQDQKGNQFKIFDAVKEFFLHGRPALTEETGHPDFLLFADQIFNGFFKELRVGLHAAAVDGFQIKGIHQFPDHPAVTGTEFFINIEDFFCMDKGQLYAVFRHIGQIIGKQSILFFGLGMAF